MSDRQLKPQRSWSGNSGTDDDEAILTASVKSKSSRKDAVEIITFGLLLQAN